ncbi:MAG: UDP-N-acetylmuramate dehydrogenase [Clostridia bacterium]|jgi:UDP-N-acetylmuramate dehydrogenase
MDIQELYQKLILEIPQEAIFQNESMKKHTSFRIGGPADILLIPSDVKEIQYAIQLCKDMNIPHFIMGNGSNLLVRDKGIRGLVIKISERYKEIKVEGTRIHAQAGILLSSLSCISIQSSLAGLEFCSGIPGTLGGAVTMNAGAYGGEMKNVVSSVTVLDENNQIKRIDHEELDFGYRSSVIQKKGYVVLEVDLDLKPGDMETSKKIVEDLTRRRREKQPISYPSAGSAFKRPVGYYAGKLIQDCGLKGMRIGDAQISELHAGFIINLGNATAADVITLIELVRDKIKTKYGVEMHPEMKIVGEK